MKFQLLVKTKNAEKTKSFLQTVRFCIYHANKCKRVNNGRYFKLSTKNITSGPAKLLASKLLAKEKMTVIYIKYEMQQSQTADQLEAP